MRKQFQPLLLLIVILFVSHSSGFLTSALAQQSLNSEDTKKQRKDESKPKVQAQPSSEQQPLSKADLDRLLAEEQVETGWKVVTGDDAFLYWYNTKSITRVTDDVIRVWIKQTLYGQAKDNPVEPRRRRALSTEGYAYYSYSVVLQEYNCRLREFRILSIVDYDRSERIIKSVEETVSSWHYLAPNSIGELLLDAICKHKL